MHFLRNTVHSLKLGRKLLRANFPLGLVFVVVVSSILAPRDE